MTIFAALNILIRCPVLVVNIVNILNIKQQKKTAFFYKKSNFICMYLLINREPVSMNYFVYQWPIYTQNKVTFFRQPH